MSKLSNLELKDAFSAMSPEQLSDYKFMSKFVYEQVGVSLRCAKLGIVNANEMTCWKKSGAKQYPEELAKFLVFIYEHRDSIKSYCEIGTSTGGTFFAVDSLLRSVNSDMGYSLGIEINEKSRIKLPFEIYQKKYPEARLLLVDFHKYTPDAIYDLCFIDSLHYYDHVVKDYEIMKPFAKYIAFHDIHLPESGVEKLWKEIQGEKHELNNSDSRFPLPVGIGIVVNHL